MTDTESVRLLKQLTAEVQMTETQLKYYRKCLSDLGNAAGVTSPFLAPEVVFQQTLEEIKKYKAAPLTPHLLDEMTVLGNAMGINTNCPSGQWALALRVRVEDLIKNYERLEKRMEKIQDVMEEG